MSSEEDIRARYVEIKPYLNERTRRLFVANEARAYGWGGRTIAARATGMARSTIGRGINELKAGAEVPDPFQQSGRVRRAGSGRKSAETRQPGLRAALDRLVADAIRGDPEAPLRWVSRSQRNIVEALSEEEFDVSQKLVGRLLKKLGYSCQANQKTREGANHPDRDAQFHNINATVTAAADRGEPAISVDTKKKELVGDFKNAGRELRPKGDPEPVRVHDFQIPELGKVAPYGVYDIAANEGWVNLGTDADTAMFAVESIRRWWQRLGQERYPNTEHLVITADCGGSNGPRVRLWKYELQQFADETGLAITVTHLPPGTSKWNKIEHKLFAQISQNWRGKPLVSHEVIVQLINATTTRTGLEVSCTIDANTYPKGVKVSDRTMKQLNIAPHDFHGEWNYTIGPRATEATGCSS